MTVQDQRCAFALARSFLPALDPALEMPYASFWRVCSAARAVSGVMIEMEPLTEDPYGRYARFFSQRPRSGLASCKTLENEAEELKLAKRREGLCNQQQNLQE